MTLIAISEGLKVQAPGLRTCPKPCNEALDYTHTHTRMNTFIHIHTHKVHSCPGGPGFPHFSTQVFIPLLLLDQFVRLWVRRILHSLDFLFDFIGRVQTGAACLAVDALGKPVPVIARYADHISGLQRDVVAASRLVRVDGDLVVGVLAAEVVDVVEGVEEGRGIRVENLHDLVGHSTHLRGEEKQRCSFMRRFKAGLSFVWRVEMRAHAGALDKDECTLKW